MSLTALDSLELVERLEELTRQHQTLKLNALNEKRKAVRGRHWAAHFEVGERLTSTRLEVLERLGVKAPTEIANREAHIAYTASKQRKVCAGCGSGGGYNAGHLHWWTQDMAPLPYIMAHGGAKVLAVKDAISECNLFCGKCAKKRGGELTAGGKPKLQTKEKP